MSINSKVFSFVCDDLELQLELYTKEYIETELKKISGITVHSAEIIPYKTPEMLRKICLDDNQHEKYHFFAYIKFFSYQNEKYGIVGGKTNYPYCDICFDKLSGSSDHRIARAFLKDHHLEWDHEVLIINHAMGKERKTDELQSLLIERYLQRKFNLFDS